MTSLSRLLAVAAVASFALAGAAIAQTPSGATTARDSMMNKEMMDCGKSADAMKKKECEAKNAEMMKHGDMKKDEMKKDGMMKKDDMKK